jgi:hypothetical protein
MRRPNPLREYAGAPTQTFLVHGFFKAGVFVESLDRAVETLRPRGVKDIGVAQSDDSLGLRWVLFRDNSGNFLQLLQRRQGAERLMPFWRDLDSAPHLFYDERLPLPRASAP